MSTDIAWLRRELERYTYKPGWKLQIFDALGSPMLIIEAELVDSRYAPGPDWVNRPLNPPRIRIASRTPFDIPAGNSAVFAFKLQRAILNMEDHESREWLRRDGQIYDDPHEGDQTDE